MLPRGIIIAFCCLAACHSPSDNEHSVPAAVARTLGALPWDESVRGAAVWCPTLAPCDTILVEPRLVRLPHPAPVFFVPDSRPSVLNLAGTPLPRPTGLIWQGRTIRAGSWTECLARRHDAAWPTFRTACVALAVAGDSLRHDTLELALLVLSPAEGLSWPRLQLISEPRGWRARVLSIGGE